MSVGTRIPVQRAIVVAQHLMTAWGMEQPACQVVGSLRRRWTDPAASVGDIELVAPLPEPGAADPLCQRIAASMPAEGLFPGAAKPIGRVASGLKTGFKAASLVVRCWDELDVGVQVYRYTPANRGWLLIERTGPAEFGRWFLGRWKVFHGIPPGDARFLASIDNHLVDRRGEVVPVATEQDAFARCGMGFVAPELRERVARRAAGVAGGRHP